MADPNDGTPMNIDTDGAGGASGSTGTTDTGIKNPDNLVMKVHHIDVGQGDSSLIVVKEGEKKSTFSQIHKAVLIDAGADLKIGSRVFFIINQILLHNPEGMEDGVVKTDSAHLMRKPLDAIINSHADEDHIGGLPVIIYSYMCDANTKIYDQAYINFEVKGYNNKKYYSNKNTKLYTKIVKMKRLLLQLEIMCECDFFYKSDFLDISYTTNKRDIDGEYKTEKVSQDDLNKFKIELENYNNWGILSDNTIDWNSYVDKHGEIVKYVDRITNDLNYNNKTYLVEVENVLKQSKEIEQNVVKAIFDKINSTIKSMQGDPNNLENIKGTLNTTDNQRAQKLVDKINNCLVRVTDPIYQREDKYLVGKSIFELKKTAADTINIAEMKCVAANKNVLTNDNPQIIETTPSPTATLNEKTIEEYKIASTPVNQRSLAFLITFNGYYYYTGGDICCLQEVLIAEYLETKRIILDSFNVSHHGSEHSTPQELVARCDKYTCAFVSYGWKAAYSHPTHIVFNRIIAKEVKLMLTSLIDFINKSGQLNIKNLMQLGEIVGFINDPQTGSAQNSRGQIRYDAPGTIVLKVVNKSAKEVTASYDQLLEPKVDYPIDKEIIISKKIITEMIYCYYKEKNLMQQGNVSTKKQAALNTANDLFPIFTGEDDDNSTIQTPLKKTGGLNPSFEPGDDWNKYLSSKVTKNLKKGDGRKASEEQVKEFTGYCDNVFNIFRDVQVAAKRVRIKNVNNRIQGMKMTIPVRGGTP